MPDYFDVPENRARIEAEAQKARALLSAALGRLIISPRCRLDVQPSWIDGEYRWTLQGGGCEVLWNEEPSQADIDKSTRLLTIGDPSYFRERG